MEEKIENKKYEEFGRKVMSMLDSSMMQPSQVLDEINKFVVEVLARFKNGDHVYGITLGSEMDIVSAIVNGMERDYFSKGIVYRLVGSNREDYGMVPSWAVFETADELAEWLEDMARRAREIKSAASAL